MYKLKIEKKDLKIYLIPIIAFFAFIGIWQFLIFALKISPLIIPSMQSVLNSLTTQSNVLISNSFITLIESVAGFLIGLVTAFILATLFQFSKLAKIALYPYAIAMRAVPIIVLAPIVTIWFTDTYSPKILMSAIISFFPILVNLIKGFNSVEVEAVELMKTFNATDWQIFRKIRIPQSIPLLFTGLKISSSYSVIACIVTEYSGANDGIGYLIKSSSYYNESALTFAAIFVACVTSLLFFGIIVAIEKIFVFWEHDN